MAFQPTASAVVVRTALAEPFKAAVPRVAVPLEKVTEPVAPADTVAVKVTAAPLLDGLAPLVRAVVVVGRVSTTVWVSAAEVLDEVPTYWAVMACTPPPRAVVVTLA